MKLAAQLSTFAALLEGRVEVAATREALFGPQADSPDARRLAIYERFCRIHRAEALQGVYPLVRGVIEQRHGEDAWAALHEAYFRAHPMHHVELNENGAHFSAWLATRADLPPWLATLAEVEWWDWACFIAPDEPAGSTPRLSATVEVRPLEWDVDAWLDAEREGEPARRDHLVVFWRDRDLDSRRGAVTTMELVVLKSVSEGVLSAPARVDADEFERTLEDLRSAGIVLP